MKTPHDMTKSEGLIFFGAKWVNKQNEVTLSWGNRVQNHLFHMYYFFTKADIESHDDFEIILKSGFEVLLFLRFDVCRCMSIASRLGGLRR